MNYDNNNNNNNDNNNIGVFQLITDDIALAKQETVLILDTCSIFSRLERYFLL